MLEKESDSKRARRLEAHRTGARTEAGFPACALALLRRPKGGTDSSDSLNADSEILPPDREERPKA
jgi:hypothetical protein